jgi:hypothetical protein
MIKMWVTVGVGQRKEDGMKKLLGGLIAAALLIGCGKMPFEVDRISGNQPVAMISDGKMDPAGNAHFFFLAPIVRKSGSNGVFDGSLQPVVEVRELAGTPAAFTVTSNIVFTTAGTKLVKICDHDFYYVNWKTRKSDLEADTYYRLIVSVAGQTLGFADIAVCDKRREVRNVNSKEYFPLLDDRTLPIKFRIEKGALSQLGSTGGQVRLAGGAVALDIPQGALTGNILFTATPVTPVPTDSGLLSVFDMGPDGLQFAAPVKLTINYNEADLPAGISESSLTLLDMVNGSWVEIPSTVDSVNNTVSGYVTHFSKKGLGVKVIQIVLNSPTVFTGQSIQLTATLLNSSGAPVKRTVTYSSSNPAIATVDVNGLVNVLDVGTATITATSGSASASITVTTRHPN